MSATQAYDARYLRAEVAQQEALERDRARYAADPAQATIDVLDEQDLQIARMARERFDRSHSEASALWSLSPIVRWSLFAAAALDRHPNPARPPCA